MGKKKNATITDNRSILQKADLTTGDLTTGAGLLQPAQARRFIRIMIDETVLSAEAQVRGLRAQTELVEKIRFGSRALRAGNEGVALPDADRVIPDLTKVELNAQLFKAEVRFTDETLEDNIESGRLKTTIMQTLGERAGVDVEEVVINGDTTSVDPFLAKFDGALAQATTNVVDATGATLTKSVLRDAIKALPSEFHRLRNRMRFYTSILAREDYADSIGDRATGAGDRQHDAEAEVRWRGIPVRGVGQFPETLAPGNETEILMLDPRNLIIGFWRRIRMEEDRLVREGSTIVVASLRFDTKYEEETAVVKVINVAN